MGLNASLFLVISEIEKIDINPEKGVFNWLHTFRYYCR